MKFLKNSYWLSNWGIWPYLIHFSKKKKKINIIIFLKKKEKKKEINQIKNFQNHAFIF